VNFVLLLFPPDTSAAYRLSDTYRRRGWKIAVVMAASAMIALDSRRFDVAIGLARKEPATACILRALNRPRGIDRIVAGDGYHTLATELRRRLAPPRAMPTAGHPRIVPMPPETARSASASHPRCPPPSRRLGAPNQPTGRAAGRGTG
jgi:hypothetical protein